MKRIITVCVLLLCAVLVFASCTDNSVPTEPQNTTEPPTTQQTPPNTDETELPGCEHVFGEAVTVREATCADEGEAERKCTLCGFTSIEKLPKSEQHTEVIDRGSIATCTKEGVTEGKHCSVCDLVIVKQEKLPKLDHKFVNNRCSCGKLNDSVGLEITSNGSSCVVRGIGSCTDTCIVIPSTYEGLPVTFINANAFEKNNDIVEVIIPDSVTDIGTKAFYQCKNLKTVDLGDGITVLANECFAECTALVKITFPKELFRIADRCFYGCRSITNLSLPEELKVIHEYAFADCTSLKSVFLPGSLRTIHQFAFYGSDNVESYRFGGNISLFRSVEKGFECFGYSHPPINCIDGECYDY